MHYDSYISNSLEKIGHLEKELTEGGTLSSEVCSSKKLLFRQGVKYLQCTNKNTLGTISLRMLSQERPKKSVEVAPILLS